MFRVHNTGYFCKPQLTPSVSAHQMIVRCSAQCSASLCSMFSVCMLFMFVFDVQMTADPPPDRFIQVIECSDLRSLFRLCSAPVWLMFSPIWSMLGVRCTGLLCRSQLIGRLVGSSEAHSGDTGRKDCCSCPRIAHKQHLLGWAAALQCRWSSN